MEAVGILNICKLPGMSSHEVVLRVRRIVGMKRVGHAGTLDPSACGVLVVCLGQATRLSDYISSGLKTYRAEFTFGLTTDSADAEGDVTGSCKAGDLREPEVAAAMQQFTGTFAQRPPEHSAIWIDGQRAYHLARRGAEMQMPLRQVTVEVFTLLRFIPGPRARLLADITCSKGTYIRALARDLGEAVATGATLSFLARTGVGGCRLEEAVTLDEVRNAVDGNAFEQVLQPPDTSLTHIPSLDISPIPTAAHYRAGNPLPLDADEGLYRVYLHERFLGLARTGEGLLRSVVNFQ